MTWPNLWVPLLFLSISSFPSWDILAFSNTKGFVPFQKFVFAPNDVCLKPSIFYTECKDLNESDKDSLEFTMRNVPGQGDCMFQAVALGTMASMGLGGNAPLLQSVADEIRNVMAQILSSPKGNLYVEGKRVMKVTNLLLGASEAEGLSPDEYITALTNRTLQGGGPELTILSNVLRRPISIYELDDLKEGDILDDLKEGDILDDLKEGDIGCNENENANSESCDIPNRCKIREVGLFGEIFRDPCSSIPDSAILSNTLQQGAYSWHIHILVVDSGNNEKHACVLLPQK